MKGVRVGAVLLAALALAGCGQNKREVLAQCRLDATKATISIADDGVCTPSGPMRQKRGFS
jgi:hypothetical protein